MKYVFLIIATVVVCIALGRKLKYVALGTLCFVCGFWFCQVCNLDAVKTKTQKIESSISSFMDKFNQEEPTLKNKG